MAIGNLSHHLHKFQVEVEPCSSRLNSGM